MNITVQYENGILINFIM